MGRYQACIDLHIIMRDEHGRVLLGERRNTGWADGQLGLPSGHLEDRESASAGVHHYTNSGRVALFFEARSWSGDIDNREPDKCAGWDFYDLNALPANVVLFGVAAYPAANSGTQVTQITHHASTEIPNDAGPGQKRRVHALTSGHQ